MDGSRILSIAAMAALGALHGPALAAGAAGAASSAVGAALERPAVTVRQPTRAVLLAGAHAGDRLVAVGERGLILVSDDQAASWRQVAAPTSVTLTAVRFADARVGVAVGHGGVVLSTGDGGQTWTKRLDGRRAADQVLAAADTPERQRDAERLVAEGADKPLLDVLVWDDQRWLVVGAFGLALETRDGGRSWQSWMARLPNPRSLHWYVARRQGDTLMLAGEQGLVARSSDGGASFQAVATPYKGSWFSGEIRADGGWILGGLRGNVWQSADGVAAWTPVRSPVPSTVTAMAANAGGALLVATQSGALLALVDASLKPLPTGTPLPMPSALLPLRDGRLLTLGLGGLTPVALTPAKGQP